MEKLKIEFRKEKERQKQQLRNMKRKKPNVLPEKRGKRQIKMNGCVLTSIIRYAAQLISRLVGQSVGWSVSLSVAVSFLTFTDGFCITAPAQMLQLAFLITALAEPHATRVAVYPAWYCS